ncbi:putative RiPP precursor [Frankia sp. R43]|uniref:putative RiPP precursor n=1 Tax=Frankia sp. R43 TaxID=269536 RepID=UPI000ACF96F5|nr:putative RiPP precursor [Frankia sp. R43]
MKDRYAAPSIRAQGYFRDVTGTFFWGWRHGWGWGGWGWRHGWGGWGRHGGWGW